MYNVHVCNLWSLEKQCRDGNIHIVLGEQTLYMYMYVNDTLCYSFYMYKYMYMYCRCTVLHVQYITHSVYYSIHIVCICTLYYTVMFHSYALVQASVGVSDE